MNSLRSTERTLTLLKIKANKGFIANGTAKLSTKPTSNLKINSNLQKIYKRALSASVIRGTKIRVLDLNSNKVRFNRSLSSTTNNNNLSYGKQEAETTVKERFVPLINPEKPEPDYDKPLDPIQRPLTQPRFSKNTSEGVPSVTRVLSATMPAASVYVLEKWKEAMIKKLGVAGFAQYQKETFERGTILHSLVANYLLDSSEPIAGKGQMSREIVTNLWRSIEKVVREKITNVRLIEHTVSHPQMKYRGIVDCVACYDGQLVVIDFKTSEKPKKSVESLYDNPLQVTAYCGAINNDKSIPKHVIDRNICAGLVVVAYIDGNEASTYFMGREQITEYWKQWTTRLDQYIRMDESVKPKQAISTKSTNVKP